LLNPTDAIDLLGHVFYVLIFWGTNQVAKKRKSGWVLRFIGEAGWAALGVALGLTSIWVWGMVFLANDAYGYLIWKQTEENEVI